MARLIPLILLGLFLALPLQAQDNPIVMLKAPAVSPVVLDRAIPEGLPSAAGHSPWQRLTTLSLSERSNAQLQLAVPSDVSPEVATAARDIEAQWNSGEYDRAIDSYAALAAESDIKRVETTISWHVPVQTSLARVTGGDVILGTSDTISAVDVVCDSSGHYLFAVVVFQSSVIDGYDLLKSTDRGASWAVVSTNNAGVIGSGKTVSIGFVKNRVRLMYLISDGAELRWRQYDTAGVPVAFPSGSYISLAGPSASPTVREVKLFTNNHYYNNRLYYATILSDNTAHMYWAFADSAYFTTYGYTSHAWTGLSAVWAAYSKTVYYVSYVDTAYNACIDSVAGGFWGHKLVVPGASSTSLGFFKDTVVCVHDVGGSPQYCSYEISYNAGVTWNNGSVDQNTVLTEYPAISMEKGQGMAIIYRYYSPTRESRIISRRYQGPGVWTTPLAYSAYEPFPVPAAITALGNGTWGMVYVAWVSPYNAYFVTYTDPALSTSVDRSTGVLPASFTLNQNYPNPFNPSTTISYGLPGKSHVTLTVFNSLGQQIATLVDGNQEAGNHEVYFNASSLASGMYFYRIQTGNFVQTKKLLLLR